MKTIALKIYKFNELNIEAKEKAINDHRNEGFYPWKDDNNRTLEEFEKIFSVKIKDWEYGYRNYINYDILYEEDILKLTGIRLLKYIYNNYDLFKNKYIGYLKDKPIYSKCQYENCCILTGYSIDDDILKPIYDFLKNPNNNTNIKDLMNDCLQSWVYSCNKDYEYSQSDECIIKTIEANDYDFLIDGTLY